jgi:hypothetical protein
MSKSKMAVVHHAHCEKTNGHGTSRPSRTEKWHWYITPIENRKMAVVHHARCKNLKVKKQDGRGTSRPLRKGKMAVVHHAHCSQKKGSDTSCPSQKEKWQKEKWPWYITRIAKRIMAKRKLKMAVVQDYIRTISGTIAV